MTGDRPAYRLAALVPGVWPPARRRVAALAGLVAVLTGTGMAALAAYGWQVLGAAAFVVAAVAGLAAPGAIGVALVGGVALAGSLMMGPWAVGPLALLPVVAGIVATAELLALVGRLDTPVPRDAGGELRRAGWATLIATAAYGVVAVVGAVPGPTGFLAVVAAAVGGAGVAVLLMRVG
ncbi:MAG: hypothetical protein P8Z36_08425 [Gemmatimonadota bacterium]